MLCKRAYTNPGIEDSEKQRNSNSSNTKSMVII
uniref:Uncharacterized protein n=1 Tax=Ascaris lumbricoides TaxID=6252 RepID=A0A9J2PUG9_ASCLU